MNSYNFSAQQLSTLTYYYVYSALKWMIIKFSKNIVDTAFDYPWFKANYELPPGVNNNPIGITLDLCKSLIEILFK